MSLLNLDAREIRNVMLRAGWLAPHHETEAGYLRSSAKGVFLFSVTAETRKILNCEDGGRYLATVGETPHFFLPQEKKPRHVWFDMLHQAFLFHDYNPQDNVVVEALNFDKGFDRIFAYAKHRPPAKQVASHNHGYKPAP